VLTLERPRAHGPQINAESAAAVQELWRASALAAASGRGSGGQ
jgi:hypothetical protein